MRPFSLFMQHLSHVCLLLRSRSFSKSFKMFVHLNQGNEDGGFLITKPLLMNLIFGINLPHVTLLSALSQLFIPSLNHEKFEKKKKHKH